MDEVKKTRKPRVLSAEAKIRAIDKKILKLQAQIAALEAEKVLLAKPIRVKEAVDEAIKKMTPEEIAEKLGIEVE